jgi:hypothetical protein
MSTQIFKTGIPDELFTGFLNLLCLKNDKHYTFNSDSYKKGIYTGAIQQFITECMPYYHISKRKYLNKKLTYNSLATIIRQICKFNKFTYTSKIVYDRSTYDIVYYIYFKI